MSENIRILILDLDGTLARTEHIHGGPRTPFDLLGNSPPGFRTSPLLYRQDFKPELNLLIQNDIAVIVITQAPTAYASTLLQLLGIDFTECYPSSESFASLTDKIRFIRDSYQVTSQDILYVGDSVADEMAAKSVGCRFEYPFWIPDADANLKEKSLYLKLVGKFSEESEEEFSSYKLSQLEYLHDSLAEGSIGFDAENLEFVGIDSDYEGIQLFLNPFLENNSFSPVINPQVISRWDYENSSIALSSLSGILNLIFTPIRLVPGHYNYRKHQLQGIEIRAFTKYMGTYLGEILWSQCKDWRGKSTGSGSEVRLHLLELPAMVMSAALEPQAILIPAPPSQFSETKPGEISRRLAERIAQIRRTNVLDIFWKDPQNEIRIRSTTFIPSGEFYCLVDDQLTDGKTIETCFENLPVQVQKGLSLIIWSYSASGGRWVESPIPEGFNGV